MVNNAAIGLMADDPIQVSQGLLAALQHGLQATRHGFHRKTKDRLANQRDRGRNAGGRAARAAGVGGPGGGAAGGRPRPPAAAALLTGSFVVETIFQIPGLGRFFISSALDNDYTMIMGCVMLYSAFIIGFNLLSDLLLAAVNPRIAREMKK